MKKGFTLAEVLITLGIIGVVAAMTIPTLAANVQKKQTAAKVHKFYSLINQVVRLSIADNGDPSGWVEPQNYNYSQMVNYLNTYFLPYIKYLDYHHCSELGDTSWSNNGVCTTLLAGSLFSLIINEGSVGIIYYSDGKLNKQTTHNTFAFEMGSTNSPYTQDKYYVLPHIFKWDGKRENLFSDGERGCKNDSHFLVYCTKLLEMNNWEFPKDYPW